MDSQPSVAAIVLGTIAFAVGTVLALFVGALLFGRHIQMKSRDAPLIRQQVTELWKQQQGAALRWPRWQFIVGLVVIAFVSVCLAVVILARCWYLLPVVIAVMAVVALPLSFVLHGLEILDRKYAVINPPFRPVRLLTGDAAVRYGTALLCAGLVLALCVLVGILAGLSIFSS